VAQKVPLLSRPLVTWIVMEPPNKIHTMIMNQRTAMLTNNNFFWHLQFGDIISLPNSQYYWSHLWNTVIIVLPNKYLVISNSLMVLCIIINIGITKA